MSQYLKLELASIYMISELYITLEVPTTPPLFPLLRQLKYLPFKFSLPFLASLLLLNELQKPLQCFRLFLGVLGVVERDYDNNSLAQVILVGTVDPCSKLLSRSCNQFVWRIRYGVQLHDD